MFFPNSTDFPMKIFFATIFILFFLFVYSIIPLLANPPQLYARVAKNIIERYEKDPVDILPQVWLDELESIEGAKQGVLPEPAQEQQPEMQPQQQPTLAPQPMKGAERLTPRPDIPERPSSFGQRLISKISSPLRST